MHTQFLTDIRHVNMSLKAVIGDGQVDKIIDQAAAVAKEKVGDIIGTDKKKAGGAKGQKEGGGIGNALSGAIGKTASDAAAKSAADQAMDIGNILKF